MAQPDYSINFPCDLFTYKTGVPMYNSVTHNIKADILDYGIKNEFTLNKLQQLYTSQDIFNVKDLNHAKRMFMFRVADIDSDNIVSLEWVGYQE